MPHAYRDRESDWVFFEFGRLLSTRPDLLPPSAVAEVRQLHASMASVPEAAIRAVHAEWLGRPIDEMFARSNFAPLDSASIAQMHATRLHDGLELVVRCRTKA
ncbi:MAG: hypothetical protein LC667_04090 [Thioalkalivibrio sp.]|nr:hypothetical protein [Thioalkalivibrio sp.]